MSKNSYYEVRVRECLYPTRIIRGIQKVGKWVKKSKFYFARSPKEAASHYKGPGSIISAQKVNREKLLGVRDFLTLGDSLLKELREGGGLLDQLGEVGKEKKIKRRYYERRKKETTH